ncbi:hypothetical protein [Salmonella enterica]|uniref:hypothetical protein n=1 Tax=Salmonella enterica TaxID=28901 RepID=UPI001FAFFDEE|nr:hypothetical protein [Salmonella enterica]
MLTEKYDFRITDQMTILLRPHWIANDSYREKCKMLVLNRSKGEIHKVDFSKLTDYIKEGDVISLASRGSRKVFGTAKFPWGIQLPSVIGGYPPSTLKIKMVAKISAFTGRAIPVVGWIILASDVSQIAYRTVRDYNRIARGSDKIW